MKTVATVIVLSAVLSSGSAFAASQLPEPRKPQLGIDVIVDGMKATFPDTEPFFDDADRTMVPVRFVSEKLGAEVLWDNKAQIVTINYKGKVITMPVNSKVVTVDGVEQTLDTSAILSEGRVVVPLRFVSETLDTIVKWDGSYNAITVSSKDFLDRIEDGTIKVDTYGRKLRINTTSNIPKSAKDWQLLEDTENYAYDVAKPYTLPRDKATMSAMEVLTQYTINKKSRDNIVMSIKNNYKLALNVDYRTIDASTYYKSSLSLYWKTGGTFPTEVLYRFVDFIKKNHVITQGYAFPDANSLYRKNGEYFMRTKFKFKVISSDDMSQFSMDSYNPSSYSESPDWVKKNQWYIGYADVRLDSNTSNYFIETLKMKNDENMFILNGPKGSPAYSYKELK